MFLNFIINEPIATSIKKVIIQVIIVINIFDSSFINTYNILKNKK